MLFEVEGVLLNCPYFCFAQYDKKHGFKNPEHTEHITGVGYLSELLSGCALYDVPGSIISEGRKN